MKFWVVFVILLFIFMPISFAKEVEISELFEVESQENIVTAESHGKEVYYYSGVKIIASLGESFEYVYNNRLGSNFESKTLPFGQPLIGSDRFSFTGKELDEDLYYFNARYYDPELGRFNSVDPVEENHPYTYVENNPVNSIDPTGKDEEGRRRIDLQIRDTSFGEFYPAYSDPDGGTYFDPLNYGGGGYMSAYAHAGIAGMALIGVIYGGYVAIPYVISGGAGALTTIAAHPLETMIVGGMIGNAMDPNPAADHLPGIPGDEIGNVIGGALRSGTRIAMDSSKTARDFMNLVTVGLSKMRGSVSQGDDVANVLMHGDYWGDFKVYSEGKAILLTADEAAYAVSQVLPEGTNAINLLSCYGSRLKIQEFTNSLAKYSGRSIRVNADVSGASLWVTNHEMLAPIRRSAFGTHSWTNGAGETMSRWTEFRIPAYLWEFNPSK